MIKRRDKRGRILHNGESQLSDGRYRFKPICLIILPPMVGILQYLMGHSGIEVTLNNYTHVRFEDAKAEITKLKVM